jgi:hypothetical protein
MKYKHIIMTAGLLLTACSRHNANDATFSKQILGTWQQASAPPGVDSTMTFASDGTFSIPSDDPSHPKPYAGTWQISGGVLLIAHTDPVGTNEQSKIVRLDDHQMISETFSLKR